MNIDESKRYLLLISILIVVSASALFGGIMEPDGALYASIAKNIALHNDWLNLYVRGADWLDKPHLPFWLAAISFKLFGISSFAYKLPSFLFGLIATWYTYGLAKDIYDKKTGLISALIFLSALHVLISTFDVRAEIYITAFTLASIYHYYKAHQHRFWHIVAGSLFAACAIMVKGIFVLIPVFGGFIIYWLLTKQFKELLKIKWWIAIVLIFLFITPELYSLYIQFDLHPEKTIFSKTNVSGLKFFFWDSQFGRFFNNGPIKGKGDISFFLHTTIWAFLPWSFLFCTAIVNLFKRKNNTAFPRESIIIWTSAAITFLLFSLSKFQLPHYILIILPQFAIITALYLQKLSEIATKIFFTIQSVVSILVAILISVIACFFNFDGFIVAIFFAALFPILGFLLFKKPTATSIIGRSVLISYSLAIFLCVFFYPAVLKYEAGMEAGLWLNKNHPHSNVKVLMYPDAYSLDFYAKGDVQYIWNYKDLENVRNENNTILYIQDDDLAKLKKDYNAEVLKGFVYYHITKLTPKFINKESRPTVLEHFYLVRLH
ncbi:glycosyl transferase [Pedobacter chinensis]|uniref:Glycosyl transferase n=1 Tax=Pedobacter chinensis TaxID=2282421 RepID=A0A369Q312_9SPHI|nr:glycosyltransferase family 39 protein [Pedobacter chinensis]RDC57406.1 glycosyl transferase [Pedobacter chinensis]